MRQLQFVAALFAFIFWGCQEDVVTPVQKGILAGKVILKKDGSPVFDAEITTSPTTKTLATAPDGTFNFGEIAVGTYTVRASKDGFLTDLEAVAVEKDDSVFVLFKFADDSLANRLPLAAKPLLPANFASNQKRDLILKWRQAEDEDRNEALEYTVFLWKNGSADVDTIVERTTDTTAILQNLDFAGQYFWQILTFDKSGEAVFGPVFQFETEPFPDNRFLFCRRVDGVFQIFSSNQTGTTAVQLTSGAANHFRPRMNPGRTKIAFLSDAGLETHLYLMNRDGSGVQKVTTLPVAGFTKLDLDFAWSPDGAKLLYPSQNRLYRINADGSGLSLFVEAPTGQTFIECDWNGPTQRILARTTGAQIFNSEILLFDELGAQKAVAVKDTSGSTGGPVFSIDGQKMLYTHDVSGFDALDGRQLDARVFQKTVPSGAPQSTVVLKPAGTNDLDARYSPDGAKIIFVNTNNDGISTRSVWTMNLDGSGRTKLFDDAEMPEWR